MVELAQLAAAEAQAAQRCSLVQSYIDKDPTARRILFSRSSKWTGASLWSYAMTLAVLLLAAVMAWVSPAHLQGIKAILQRLAHQ